ncbi:TIGR04028 family ABC transporter substrate-binding protein [Nocardiopsis alba]|uniref:TIGR04028 family ABC transporter substrate-binding protein n=1 Tax=Nocardiopsis alba TaxID=53437 RepID=A0A7K2IXU0_9ACTN|nr:TIGR04028 family ABC transporter substrate-binding protein [Nocardiopsis sp. LDBS1602]MEC3892030.1 TIGR04028 family ABC transporter substrate-binding protein [Nocardiopsis sp. LDBS1602]MYR34595.1 TIGR04028 family ABC transporter substrate-binding protein [Nocardiopsis alba]
MSHAPIPSRALLLPTAAVLALLTACGSPASSGAGADGEPVQGGSLVYLEYQPHDSLYPPEAGFYPNGGLVNNIADRLVHQDPETLEFEPWIATDWEVDEDATEYTFTLRDDVTFSDGSPLDAEVVAANFDLYGLGDQDRALIVSEAINNYESSEVLDENTVRFHFDAPSPGFLQATSTINSGLLSAETLELAQEGFSPGNATEVIGSGPFVVSDEELGTGLTLTAREDYAWAPESWENQGRPYLDEVRINVTPEDSVRVGALTSGQAHVARYVQAQDEERVEAAGIEILAPQTNGVNNSLSLRFGNEILSDLKVRRALVAGIDRQEVVDTIYTDHYPPATSTLSSTAQGYADQSEYLEYDPERAEELLEEAGWTVGSDGIREKDGERLSLVVNEAAPQPRSFETLTLVGRQLAGIGVDLQILAADAGTYTEAINDPDQVQLYHSMVGRADHDVIKSQYHSRNRNTLLNRDPKGDSVEDERLEELLEAVASTADPEERDEASAEAQRYLSEQAYVIPLFEEPQVYGVAPSVHGIGFESVARPSFQGVWLSE